MTSTIRRHVGLTLVLLAIGVGGCAGGRSPSSTWDKRASADEGTLVGQSPSKATFQLASAAIENLSGAEAPAEATSVLPPTNRSIPPRDGQVEPDRFDDLSEDQMLALALASSPMLRPLGIRVLENPAAATTIFDRAIDASDPFFGPQAALAEFDSQLSASLSSQNNDRVFNNATLGGDVQELVQDFSSLNTGLQKRNTWGTIFQLGTTHNYDNNNRVGNRFPNYWETQWEAGIRQPLLQGAGRNFNLIAGPNAQPGFNFSNGVWIARLNNRVTDAEFEITLREFVRGLYRAYWELRQQYASYESVVKARALSYRTWQTVLAKSEAGLPGGEADKEAQAHSRYLADCRRVQITLGGDGNQAGLYAAQRQLRYLIGLPVVDDELLRPVDLPVDAKITFEFDSLVSRGISSRTELKRQALVVRQEELKLVAAKNFLLPQLDVITRYRARGFGDDLGGRDTDDRFASAYRDLFSLDHQEWEFGLEMGVTAGRRQARAAVRNASLKINRERTLLAEQRRSVELEIANAHAEVASAYSAMDLSRAQVDASRARLSASLAQYASDKIQIEFLIDAQSELLQAELQLAADQSRYAIALVEVSATCGSLLEDLGIGVCL